MKRKIRNKVKLHPVMSVLIIIFGVIILSLLLSIFNFSFSYTSINSSRGEYISTTESIINMFSLHGLKYIFANTVANFANYKVLSNLNGGGSPKEAATVIKSTSLEEVQELLIKHIK